MSLKTLKCPKCQKDLEIQVLEGNRVQISCKNSGCDYVLSFIDQKMLLSEQVNIESSKSIIRNKRPVNALNPQMTKIHANQEDKIIEAFIFCFDISSRMDRDIPFHDDDIKKHEAEILNNPYITREVKDNLLEAISAPISYYRALLFLLSKILLKSIEKMNKNEITSVQFILMAEQAEEIFQFPNLAHDIESELVLQFLNEVEIKRHEYRSNGELEFRNFRNAIKQISNSLIDLKESFPHISPKIYLITTGNHSSKDKQYYNLLRGVRNFMEDLEPFSLNIITLNPIGEDRILKQVSRKNNGYFSNECTFRAISNTLLEDRLGTEPFMQSIQISKSAKKPIHLLKPVSIPSINQETVSYNDTKTLTSEHKNHKKNDDTKDSIKETSKLEPEVKIHANNGKVKIPDDFFDLKQKEIVNWKENKITKRIERKADNALDALKKERNK